MSEEVSLPPELEKLIKQQRADGVYLHRVRRDAKGGRSILGIDWTPGDRNALAEVIIERVKPGEGKMELVLNGHHYWIESQEEGE